LNDETAEAGSGKETAEAGSRKEVQLLADGITTQHCKPQGAPKYLAGDKTEEHVAVGSWGGCKEAKDRRGDE
jgi:hypothetical protein